MNRTLTKTLAAGLLATGVYTGAGVAGATPAGISLQPTDTAASDTAGSFATGAVLPFALSAMAVCNGFTSAVNAPPPANPLLCSIATALTSPSGQVLDSPSGANLS
ncbi:hypothetical protein [Nocardia stercoris]|uniref:Uncharacterized protein n=1 Tax=Nocardia stercoris TaxID=2483361 RepID=A0A3M2KZJ9_9NOCA|nr:hypothetical protein [Nocardia stercoris]RMI30917.1 hypothetical protein EBN03_19990 [Nocardia stercoris]